MPSSLARTMPKREQYRMALVPGDHDAHIGGQIDDLDVSDGLKEVLRSALAHAPSARCTAAELARDLDDIAEACPGPTLRRWARAHTWPTPEALESELVGRRITEGRPVSSSSNAIGPGKVVARQIRRSPASPSVPAPPPRSIGVAELSPAASAPPAWRRSRTPSSGEPATSSSPLHWVVLVLVLLVALGGVALAGTGALALALTLR